jgi:Xaa-Pro aminopeptidase
MNERLITLAHRLVDVGIDAALLLHPRDVLYYAGTARPASLLVVPRAGETPEVILFVRRGFDLAQQEAAVERVEAMGGFSTITKAVDALGLAEGVLGIELDVTSAALYRRVSEAFSRWTIVDVSSQVLEQRMVKDADEIEATRRAALTADAGHTALVRTARAGMSELALAAEVERALRLAGHEGFQPLRYPEARGGGVLLASGDHLTARGGHGLVVTGVGLSPAAPYGPSRREVKPGDLMVLDFGATHAGYAADEARTFVIGTPTPAQRALFSVAQTAEEAAFEVLRPGVPIADVYTAVETVIRQGAPPHHTPGSLVLPGFVGHGLGLELDEPPVLWPNDERILQECMVLAIEVEVSSPSDRMMAKIEDTIVVRSDGCEVLTAMPRQLIVCE